MATIHADPEQLEALVAALQNQLESLRETVQAMQASLAAADDWRDFQREQYEEHLNALTAQITQYADMTEEETIPWLQGRIEALSIY